MKNTSFWATVIIVIVIALGGLFFLTGGTTPPEDNGATSLVEQVNAQDHIIGSLDAPVVLVAYEDFQCSACFTFQSTSKQLQKDFGDKYAFVFRHLPLRTIHPNAQISSQAAESAGLQGKFWEMHDFLFENQTTWATMSRSEATATFESFAKVLELDLEKYKTDFDSDVVKDVITDDVSNGNASGAPGTPALYLNGELLTVNSFDDIGLAIQAKLDSLNGLNEETINQPLNSSESPKE